MPIVTFGTWSKNLLYIVLLPLLWIIRSYIGTKMYSENEESYVETIKQHPFIWVLFSNIGLLLTGIFPAIFWVYKSVRSQTISAPDYQLKEEKFLMNKVKEKEKWWKLPLVIFCLSVFEFIQTASLTLLSIGLVNAFLGFYLKVFQIFVVIFFSWKLLKYPFYKHQWVASIILLLGAIMISIEVILLVIKNGFDYRKVITISGFLIIYCILAFKDIVEKWLMEIGHINPYVLLFYQGIISVIISLLFFIPLNYMECKYGWEFCANQKYTNESRVHYIEEMPRAFRVLFSKISVGLLLCTFSFFTMFHYIFGILINKFYTPNHKSTADMLYSIYMWIITYKYIKIDYGVGIKIVSIFGYLLILIGSLIFNEIIICYFCDLETNTKKEIMNRERDDSQRLSMISENSLTPGKIGEIENTLIVDA